MVGLYSTTRTASLGDKFLNFHIITQDESPTDDQGNVREAGYLQLKLTSSETATLAGYAGSVGGGVTNTTLGYEVIATEYMDKPVGFTTIVGITSGYWANGAGYGAAAGGYVNIPDVGIGVTQYVVILEDSNQITGFSTGDFVKLPSHDMSPDLTGGVTLKMDDQTGAPITVKNGLTVQGKLGSNKLVLTGFTTTALSHGSEPKVGDYISKERIFTIAKGRVGVI